MPDAIIEAQGVFEMCARGSCPLQESREDAQEVGRNSFMEQQHGRRAADAGVRDVVYFFYPNVPAPTLIGGTNPNNMLNWSYPQVEELCMNTASETEGRLRCHFIDTRPLFAGHDDWFAPTDIHENSTGSQAIAKAIVELMQERCLAQPAASGCCSPE